MQTLISCKDEPEPVVEPDNPNQYRPKSWFDQEHADRWPIRWQLKGSDETHGSGVHEFPINQNGEDVTFIFPDEHLYSNWFSFDGVFCDYAVYELMYGFTIEYDIPYISFHFDSNPTMEEREMTAFFGDMNNHAVKFIFRQSPGEAISYNDNENIVWKSTDHTFAYYRQTKQYNTICNSDGEVFSIMSLSHSTFDIISLSVNGVNADITDLNDVSLDDTHITVMDNVLTFNIPENISGEKQNYVITVANGEKTSTFNISQPADSQIDTEFCELRTPEWIVKRDGVELHNTNNAFKVSNTSNKLVVESINFNKWRCIEVWIDGTKEKVTYGTETIRNMLNMNMLDSGLELSFFSNYSLYERVVELRMKCENPFFNSRKYCEYSTLVFVQAPRDVDW